MTEFSAISIIIIVSVSAVGAFVSLFFINKLLDSFAQNQLRDWPYLAVGCFALVLFLLTGYYMQYHILNVLLHDRSEIDPKLFYLDLGAFLIWLTVLSFLTAAGRGFRAGMTSFFARFHK